MSSVILLYFLQFYIQSLKSEKMLDLCCWKNPQKAALSQRFKELLSCLSMKINSKILKDVRLIYGFHEKWNYGEFHETRIILLQSTKLSNVWICYAPSITYLMIVASSLFCHFCCCFSYVFHFLVLLYFSSVEHHRNVSREMFLLSIHLYR